MPRTADCVQIILNVKLRGAGFWERTLARQVFFRLLRSCRRHIADTAPEGTPLPGYASPGCGEIPYCRHLWTGVLSTGPRLQHRLNTRVPAHELRFARTLNPTSDVLT